MTDNKTREAAAIAATLMLARLAQLRFERESGMPLLPFGNYLRASAAHLLVVPTVGENDRQGLTEAMQAHARDTLVAHAGGQTADDLRFRVGLHSPRPFWSGPLRLWLGAGAPAHLVPEELGDTVFALLRVGLRGCEVPPWDGAADREAGLALGRTELARVLEGR